MMKEQQPALEGVRVPIEPFKLERYYATYEFTARYMLSSSDSESRTIGPLLALEPGAAERLHACWLGYTETRGAPWLRAEIAGLYQQVTPEQILVHSGAQEAIFTLCHALLVPGDHVVVHTPCYQSALSVPRSIGCSVTAWPGRFEDRWQPDLAALERAIGPRTRLLYLNTPQNPTGHHFPHDAFARILGLAAAHGVVVCCDEVYRELEHDPGLRLPAACDASATAISLGVMSKSYGLPGLRIGWLATRNERVLHAAEAVKDYTTICNSAPSEVLAALALRHREHLLARNLAIVHRNMPLLDSFFAAHADRFSWVRPAAGPISFPRLAFAADVEEFCHDLMESTGVLLLPGTVYDHPGHVRLGFGRHDMPAALAHLDAYLAQRPWSER
jgi:aspartate/methionine/tyrosine aminotransferase